jgi:hypothetical protein
MPAKSIAYKIHILPDPIELSNGNIYSRTAVVEKWKGNYLLNKKKLACPDNKQIYGKIKKKETINLDHCYLKDFSLKEFRKMNKMNENDPVEVADFSASGAFFESDFGTDFSYVHFTGKQTNFAYSIFNQGEVDFRHARCHGSLNFNRSEFHLEHINFKFAEFEEGDIRFSNCIFDCDDVFFINTNFGKGLVSFRQTDFRESNCSFQYARIDRGDVSFDKANFNGEVVDFRKVEFGTGKAEFRRARFGNGEINFSESEFKEGKINFRHAEFGNGIQLFEEVNFGDNEVQFDGCIFNGGFLSFKNCSFKTLSLPDTRLGGHVDLRIREGEVIDLSYAIVKDIIDLQSGDIPVRLHTLIIHGLKMMGKLFISWEDNHTYTLLTSQKDTSLRSKAEQFNLLKESFHSNGRYESEDKAYVAFKRFDMKAKLERDKQKGFISSLKGNFVYGFQWLVFDKAGLFATAPLRVFLSMIIVICLFSISYIILPHFIHAEIISSVGDPDQLNIVERSFYHSAITFFTIGYGDFYPSGHIRWLSAVEGWAGVFLMSYFTVAFVRKILR